MREDRFRSRNHCWIGRSYEMIGINNNKDAYLCGTNVKNLNTGVSAAAGSYWQSDGGTIDIRMTGSNWATQPLGAHGYLNVSTASHLALKHNGGTCLICSDNRVGIGGQFNADGQYPRAPLEVIAPSVGAGPGTNEFSLYLYRMSTIVGGLDNGKESSIPECRSLKVDGNKTTLVN